MDWLIAHGAKDEEGELLSKEHYLTDEMIIIGPSGRQWKQKGWKKQLLYALAVCSCCITDSQTPLSCSRVDRHFQDHEWN